MPKEDFVVLTGKVETNLSNGIYMVVLDSGHKIQCRMSGKMTMRHIKVIPGDTVSVEVSPYDLTKGRITYRHHVIDGRILPMGEEPPSFTKPKRQSGDKHWRNRR